MSKHSVPTLEAKVTKMFTYLCNSAMDFTLPKGFYVMKFRFDVVDNIKSCIEINNNNNDGTKVEASDAMTNP